MIGDSVTYLARQDVVTAFDWTDNVDPQGRPGWRTDELVPLAQDKVDEDRPEIFVVLTGYNDLTQGVDTSAAVGRMMDIAADQPCAVWILLPTKGRFDAADAQAFDQRIVGLAADHPDVHVEEEWRDAVDQDPGPAPDPGLVSDDEIHPTPAGLVRLAQVVEESASRHCR